MRMLDRMERHLDPRNEGAATMQPASTGRGMLRPVELKPARADQLGRVLAQTIAAWTSQNNINARHEFLEQRLGFRLIIDDFTEPPSLEEWGLTVGDYVHNLRSALDNLAYALARQHHDPPARPRDIAFPIYEEQSGFDRNGRKRIDQLPKPAAELIERLQPYQRDGSPEHGTPQRDALVLLQSLNNTDKHQVPPVVLLAPAEIHHAFGVTFETEEDAAINVPPDQTLWAGPLTPGVVLVEHRTIRPVASVEGGFQGQAIVALETPHGFLPASATLGDLGKYVWTVSGLFQEFFT